MIISISNFSLELLNILFYLISILIDHLNISLKLINLLISSSNIVLQQTDVLLSLYAFIVGLLVDLFQGIDVGLQVVDNPILALNLALIVSSHSLTTVLQEVLPPLQVEYLLFDDIVIPQPGLQLVNFLPVGVDGPISDVVAQHVRLVILLMHHVVLPCFFFFLLVPLLDVLSVR